MTTDPEIRALEPSVDAALRRLVDDGTLAPEQADAVAATLAPLVAGPTAVAVPGETGPPEPVPAAAPALAPARPTLRTRISEIAGYVGAALVVGAAVFFVSEQWDQLSTGGRVGLLAGIAVTLWVAAGAVVSTAPGGPRAVRGDGEPARRRLASTLLTAAAASAAFAVGVALEAGSVSEEATTLTAALAALAAVAAGYAVAPSLVGQLGAAVAAFVTVTTTVAMLDRSAGAPETGLGLLVAGVLWAGVLAAGLLRERVAGTLVAGGFALVGAQLMYVEESTRPWSYVLTLLVVLVSFGAYTRWPSWPLLGIGVVGATALVPEFLSDVTGGSLGVSGVMLAAGVALLASSAVGLRLHRESGG